MTVHIERAREEHFSALRLIELAAFETLRHAGGVSGDPEISTDEELRQYLKHDLLFVALNEQDVPVGYAGGHLIGQWLHIGEVDVHPEWQRRGIGRSLVSALLEEGRSRYVHGFSLTTDRYVPFNAPFYASMGFQIAGSSGRPRHLEAIVQRELAKGLDSDRRIAMQLLL